MVCVSVNLQLLSHRSPKLCLRQHAFDCKFDNSLRVLFKLILNGDFTKAARVERVMAIDLLLCLRAFEYGLSSVNHDYMIAHVHKRRPLRIALSSQNACDLSCEPSDGLPRRVNDVP